MFVFWPMSCWKSYRKWAYNLYSLFSHQGTNEMISFTFKEPHTSLLLIMLIRNTEAGWHKLSYSMAALPPLHMLTSLPTSRSRWGRGSSTAQSCSARRRWAARAAAALNTRGGTTLWSSTYPSATCRAWLASALPFMPSWIKSRSRSPPKMLT